MKQCGSYLKKCLALILMLICVMQGFLFHVFAEEEPSFTKMTEGEINEYAEKLLQEGIEKEAADERHNSVIPDGENIQYSVEGPIKSIDMIKYSFLDTGDRANTWTFPYSDKLFSISPAYFSFTFAKASMGLSASAARSNRNVLPLQYKTYLTDAGFTDLYAFGYDKPTTADTLSGVIAMKKIDDCTVIAAVTCGQGYKNEWAGNMKVGKGERHQGFEEASVRLETYLDSYIAEHSIEGKKKLWLTGMSRAAAIANLTAADAIESGEYEDVYAYLFGVPRTTKNAVRYAGIYNICGQYDPVAAIPFETWGYERYGTDVYTPSQEANSEFADYVYSAVEVGKKLDGKGFRNNPEVNYQLRLILEWLGKFFEDEDEYVDRAQPLLMEAVLNHGEGELLDILTEAFIQLKPESEAEAADIKEFLNYISYIVAQHTRADIRQVDDGSWDPEESIVANFVIEHRPSTYIKWLFSDAFISDLNMVSISSRRLTIEGNAGVTVYKDGIGITRIDSKGRITAPDPDADPTRSGDHGIFMMRNGEMTVVSLPDDSEYYVEIDTAGEKKSITYYDVTVSPNVLLTDSGRLHMGDLSNGTIGFKCVPGESLTDKPDVKSGYYENAGSGTLNYSPSNIMFYELSATRNSYLSLDRAAYLVKNFLGGIALMLFLCLILWIMHRKGRRKGHGPYSDLYVIIPHVILISGFAVLTQFFTFYLYTVKAARVISATMTLVCIFLLALNGAVRSRRKGSFAAAAAFLIFIPIVYGYYSGSYIDNFSYANLILFFVIVIAMTVTAILTFRRPKPQDDKAADQESDPSDEKLVAK